MTFTTFTYEDITVPFEYLGACYDSAQNHAKRNPEYWDTNQSRRFRELLGNDYARFDEDKLRRLAINFRKTPKGKGGWWDYKDEHNIQGRNGGNGRGTKPIVVSPKLTQHYASAHYNMMKDIARYQGKDRCRICNDPLEEFHHRDYSNLGTPQEIGDLISVCKVCHPVCDKLRREAAARRRSQQ